MNTKTLPKPLEGHTILVTRPIHQADKLCSHIEKAGGQVLRFPTLEIADPVDIEKIRSRLLSLADFDIAIFTSTNSVNKALQLLAPERLPDTVELGAIGKTTATALEDAGYFIDLVPERQYNSEGLLALDDLQDVEGVNIAVIRGEGGRDLLATTLEQRGAQLEFIEVYRRVQPETAIEPLRAALQAGGLTLISITSNDALDNLLRIAANYQSSLTRLPLVVLSERSKRYARDLGFRNHIVVAEQADDLSLLEALEECAATVNAAR